MNRFMCKFGILTLTLTISCAATTKATVTTVAWYKLGEDDPGATANSTGLDPTQDSSVNNFDLTRSGSPTYRADAAPFSAGSTLSMEFNGSTDYYSRGTPVTTATTGVGIEAWVKSDLASQLTVLAHNGNPGADGYGLIQYFDKWGILAGGVSAIQIGGDTVNPGQWYHLGLISSAGVITGYIDGAPAGSFAATPNTPTSAFQLGWNVIGGGDRFDGRMDQVRAFTFTGTFEPSDFLFAIPEPGAVMLLATGGLLLWRRR